MTDSEIVQLSARLRALLHADELLRRRDYCAALEVYCQLLDDLGCSAELHAAIANCHYALRSQDREHAEEHEREAVSWMEKAVALSPNDSRLHARLGEYYELAMLDYEQSAHHYRIAIDLNPCVATNLVAAAGLYGVPGDVVTLAEAINWLEQAVLLDPDEPVYHARLGALYLEAGRRPDAEAAWCRALLCPRPLDPGNAQMIRNGLLSRTGRQQPEQG